MNRMPRHRTYANDAARQAAYRQRAATKRNRDVTDRENLREIVERLSFIRDIARDVSQDSIRNWRGWAGAPEIHAHALQTDLDDLVARLTALLDGDAAPFQGPEFRAWCEARRDDDES